MLQQFLIILQQTHRGGGETADPSPNLPKHRTQHTYKSNTPFQACKLAVEYRHFFGKDAFVDLHVYRLHGHNEVGVEKERERRERGRAAPFCLLCLLSFLVCSQQLYVTSSTSSILYLPPIYFHPPPPAPSFPTHSNRWTSPPSPTRSPTHAFGTRGAKPSRRRGRISRSWWGKG